MPDMTPEEKAVLKTNLDTSLKNIEGSIGAFGGSTLGLAFVYRKLIMTDPAIMFGEDTEQDALDMDRDTNDAIIKTARGSNGFARQLFEWVGKYSTSDPELARLNESLTRKNMSAEELAAAQEQDEIEKEQRETDESSTRFSRFTKLFSRGVWSVGGLKDEGITTLIPYMSDAVGKEILPLMLNARPSPKMVVYLLNKVPMFQSPIDMMKHITSRVIAKVDPSGTHIAPMAEAIVERVGPIMLPFLTYIAKTLDIALRHYTHLLNSPRLAKYVNVGVRGFYKLLGWIYRLLGKMISFVVQLVYAIVKFVVSIVLTVIGNTAVTLVVTTILDLIHV